MAISDLSMSDYEARSYSNPPSQVTAVAGGANRKSASAAAATTLQQQPSAEPTKKKRGFFKRLFGARPNNNRRGDMGRSASSSSLFHRRTNLQAQSRSVSASAFTHSNPPLYQETAEPQSYAGTPTPGSHFVPSNSSNPAAYHGSYYNGGSTSVMSMSARDFRQPVNSYNYAREDGTYTDLANQQIDEDLEVSYFNV